LYRLTSVSVSVIEKDEVIVLETVEKKVSVICASVSEIARDQEPMEKRSYLCHRRCGSRCSSRGYDDCDAAEWSAARDAFPTLSTYVESGVTVFVIVTLDVTAG
jgi:hypothetical protein